jgi:hypothetical protein
MSNWVVAEFEKFAAWVKEMFSSHDKRIAALEAQAAPAAAAPAAVVTDEGKAPS